MDHEKIDEELKVVGVQVRPETVKLPSDLKQVGVLANNLSRFSTFQNIKTPLADDKVLTGLHAPITSSLRWLATLTMYILRQAHVGLKEIHGKTVRVIKR